MFWEKKINKRRPRTLDTSGRTEAGMGRPSKCKFTFCRLQPSQSVCEICYQSLACLWCHIPALRRFTDDSSVLRQQLGQGWSAPTCVCVPSVVGPSWAGSAQKHLGWSHWLCGGDSRLCAQRPRASLRVDWLHLSFRGRFSRLGTRGITWLDYYWSWDHSVSECVLNCVCVWCYISVCVCCSRCCANVRWIFYFHM
jgi:hypothetical protein